MPLFFQIDFGQHVDDLSMYDSESIHLFIHDQAGIPYPGCDAEAFPPEGLLSDVFIDGLCISIQLECDFIVIHQGLYLMDVPEFFIVLDSIQPVDEVPDDDAIIFFPLDGGSFLEELVGYRFDFQLI